MAKILISFILLFLSNLPANALTPPSHDWKIRTMERFSSSSDLLIVRGLELDQLFYSIFYKQVRNEIKSIYILNDYLLDRVSITFFKYFLHYGELPDVAQFDSTLLVMKHIINSLNGKRVELDFEKFEHALVRFSIVEN